MVTVSPKPALSGENELTVKVGNQSKLLREEPVPPGVVTATIPSAPEPTTAVITVAEDTEKEVAGIPPNVTEVAPVNPLPRKWEPQVSDALSKHRQICRLWQDW